MRDDLLIAALKKHIEQLRTELQNVETVSGFKLVITAQGRVDGEVLLDFRLGEEYDYDPAVKGNSLSAVVEEYLRRHGWKREHSPICLPAA